MSTSSQYPPVSVCMPVRNEERHLAAAVQRVIEQHYPGEWEIVLAVGPSTDRTREIAQDLADSDERIVVVDNPAGWTPVALNLAIAAARHDIIVRVDGHGELTDNYITTAVELLQRTGAANVGGFMDAQGTSPFEQAVATAYTSRLGLGGGAFHLESSSEGPVDTVYLGVFRRDALEEVGGFDEDMHRAQDWELNYRLRQAGMTVWFSPRLRVTYRPRAGLAELARQFWKTGRWRREVIRRHPETASLRYLAAPTAVVGLSAGTAAGVASTIARGPLRSVLRIGWLAPLGYLTIICGGAAVLRRDLPLGVRLRLPLVFAVMHMCWGAGFLAGPPEE